jgi:ribosomal protein L29
MKEFLNKTEKELQKMLAEKRASLREFRFGTSGSQNRNVKNGKVLRKDIARILTLQNSKLVK